MLFVVLHAIGRFGYYGGVVQPAGGGGIESYFISGRKMPVWLLVISGGSWFKVAGTMWIIEIFYSYGFKVMWPQWMWG